MKKINIQTFGGNKDAYYNFKRMVLEAKQTLTRASLYALDAFPALIPVDKATAEIAMLEFED